MILSTEMVPNSVGELDRFLIQSQLVEPRELELARHNAGGVSSVTDYLDLLQRQQILTPFQISRIKNGETDGLVLDGCKLLYRNASGSFARVYRASRVSDGTTIGVKLLRDRWSKDPDTVQLFHREGELGQRLRHPNIVPIYSTGTEGKHHYITMEFVEGGNLRDFIGIRKKLEVQEAAKYVLHMALALEYAVGQGITHRDLKTTNVLMSSQGVAKLIDFGLGADDRMLNRADSPDLAVALEYSTLEKGSGAPANDPRSDLYFLGGIFYELITGEPPYPRTRSRDERKRFGRYRDIRPITNLAPMLDNKVVSIINRLMNINPDLRYQRAGEVAEDLQGLLQANGQATQAQSNNSESSKTILCVEGRAKRQDVLRDYFSKHGYRLLLLSDPSRAVTRLKNNPPDCIVMFGDSSDEDVVPHFKQALAHTRMSKTPIVLVLDSDDSDQVEELSQIAPNGKALPQPLKLRDLRVTIEELLNT